MSSSRPLRLDTTRTPPQPPAVAATTMTRTPTPTTLAAAGNNSELMDMDVRLDGISSQIQDVTKNIQEVTKNIKEVTKNVQGVESKLDDVESQLLQGINGEEKIAILKERKDRLNKCLNEYKAEKNQYMAEKNQYMAEMDLYLEMLRLKTNNMTAHEFDEKANDSPSMKSLRGALASINPRSVHMFDFSHPPRKPTRRDRKPLREQTAKHYKVWKLDDSGEVKCQASMVWGSRQQVTTSHLLPHSTYNNVQAGREIDDINDMRNLLMLSKGIEQAYENGQIYFEYKDDRTFYLRILDSTVKSKPIFVGASRTIGDVEGRYLFLPKDVQPPCKRVLSRHAQEAFKHALKEGWINKGTKAPEEYSSPLKNNVLTLTPATSQTSQSLGGSNDDDNDDDNNNNGDDSGVY